MRITKIIKRDGREVPFEMAKLVGAIGKAGVQTGEFGEKEAKRLAEIVVSIIDKANAPGVLGVEQIQDMVEQVLMAADHYQTAKAYILYRAARSTERRVERIIGVKDDLDLLPNQLKILESRFLMKNEDGKVVETPKQMFRRVARALAKVEKKDKRREIEERFYEVMTKLEFIPAGRTLNNADTPQSQLASCFVLPFYIKTNNSK